MFVIIIGNFFVVVLYFLNLRFCIGIYMFLVSLVILDLLVGCVFLFLWIYISLIGVYYRFLNMFFIFFDILSVMVLIFYLIIVSMERWLVILCFFIYEVFFMIYYMIVICCVWMIVFVIVVI